MKECQDCLKTFEYGDFCPYCGSGDVIDYNADKKIIRENKIMKNYLRLIRDIGIDYDGYNDVKNLKDLIDEMVDYAKLGINKDDKHIISVSRDKKYNVLGEEL